MKGPEPAARSHRPQAAGLDARPGVARPAAAGWLPALGWLRGYRAADLAADLPAGLFLAVLLVPQAMAYALLAGLPPRTGLYAAMAAPLAYALLGTSRYLAVGPVALVSLMVGQSVPAAVAALGTGAATAAVALAVLTGAFLVAFGVLRLGFLIHFVSQPVLTGFTAAAALLIAATQLEHLLGLPGVERSGELPGTLAQVLPRLGETHLPTLLLGAAALAVLLAAGPALARRLRAAGVAARWRTPLVRSVPLLVLAASGAAVALWTLAERGVAVVGTVPRRLPHPAFPAVSPELVRELVPTALAVALVVYVSSMAMAGSLGGRRRQRVEPDRELVALGAANLLAAAAGGHAVGGSISRSAVSFDAGARTPAAQVVSAGLVAAAVVAAGPALALLPRAALAALIVTAVVRLVDVPAIRRIWSYSRSDAAALAVTFGTTLLAGVEWGVAAGAATGLALFVWRSSRPRVVVVGRLPDSRYFRSAERDDVAEAETSPVLVLRIDRSLFFANTPVLEDRLRGEVAARPAVSALLLDLRAVNEIDVSAFGTLERLAADLEEAGVALSLACLKQDVERRLERSGFLARLGPGRVFVSVHEGVEALRAASGGSGPAGEEEAPTPPARRARGRDPGACPTAAE